MIYVDNNTNMANALKRCSGGRSPLASCNYAITDLHNKSIVYIMHKYTAIYTWLTHLSTCISSRIGRHIKSYKMPIFQHVIYAFGTFSKR